MEFNTLTYIDMLKSEFNARSVANPSYSLRAYSKNLGISPAMLSELFSGKRKLSVPKAKTIVKKLKLTHEEEQIFIALVMKGSGKSRSNNKIGEKILHEKQQFNSCNSLTLEGFKLISDWHYYAILCTMELDQYNGSVEFISRHLGISVELIKDSIATLLRLDLVCENGKGFFCTQQDVTTTHDIISSGLRKFHKQGLMQAIESIDQIEIEKRDITSMTMSIDIQKIPQAKELIKKFRRDLCKFLETGEKNSVYKLNIQLFPIGGNIE